ncbi:hypothetical protein KKD37_03165 [Patescibacteria group bacterium]|nr:hypothetical protein [Patescibacteria group bacterium]
MFKKIFFTIFIFFNIVALAYLFIPTPSLKDLPNSVKSTEPGDTVQLKNVAGYYTNLSRTEVMNFYRSIYFAPLFVRLNHPPELSKTIFKDTMQSYYLEEFYLPFKESLYINGYEWENDVFTAPEKRVKNKLIYENKEYRSKITIRTIPTSIFQRLLAFVIIEGSIISIYYIYKRIFSKHEK